MAPVDLAALGKQTNKLDNFVIRDLARRGDFTSAPCRMHQRLS